MSTKMSYPDPRRYNDPEEPNWRLKALASLVLIASFFAIISCCSSTPIKETYWHMADKNLQECTDEFMFIIGESAYLKHDGKIAEMEIVYKSEKEFSIKIKDIDEQLDMVRINSFLIEVRIDGEHVYNLINVIPEPKE